MYIYLTYTCIHIFSSTQRRKCASTTTLSPSQWKDYSGKISYVLALFSDKVND